MDSLPHQARSALAAAATLATLLVAACGASDRPQASAPPVLTAPTGTTRSSTAPPSTSATTQPTATQAPASAPVPAVLQFTAATVDGKTFHGADLLGHKTVLWFWAPWCTVCARNAAAVKAAADTLGPDVDVVGVAGLSSSPEDMQRFVDRGGLQGLTHVADTSGEVYARFAVTQQDTYILVAPDGTTTTHPGYSTKVDVVGLAKQAFG